MYKIINFKPYPEVVELLLRHADRHVFNKDNVAKSLFLKRQNNSNEFIFERKNVYQFKVTILINNQIKIEALNINNNQEDAVNKFLSYFELNANDDNIEISSDLISKCGTTNASYILSNKEFDDVMFNFLQYINGFKHEVNSPKIVDARIAKVFDVAIGDTTLQITRYTSGNVTSRGVNNGYHEEFWKTYIDYIFGKLI